MDLDVGDDSQPFSLSRSSSPASSVTIRPRKSQSLRQYTSSIFFFFNFVTVLLNIFFFTSTWIKILTVKSYCPDPPYSPAASILRYEDRVLDYNAPSPYAGNSSDPAVIAAWQNLMRYDVWRASKEELQRAGAWHENAVGLEDGGYLAQYRMHDEICCLNWIKMEWSLYRYTKPELTAHLDRCIQSFRESAMCRADLSIGSYFWFAAEANQHRKRPDVIRRCMAWDSFMEHMEDRKIDKAVEHIVDFQGNILEIA